MTQTHRPRRRRRQRRNPLPLILGLVLVTILIFAGIRGFGPRLRLAALEKAASPQWIDVQIIEIDGASRRGEPLTGIRNIVVHYVGNPGTSAQANHDYFAGDDSAVSSHFIVGLEGEVIQCIPLREKSSASNHRNSDTISIEVCHPDETGKFTDTTYRSLVRLTAWLLDVCGLDEDDIIRHHDVTGKLCPLYYVEHEDAWEQFKQNVGDYK